MTVMHTHLSENEILRKKLGKEHMREKQSYNQMNELIAKRGFTVPNGLSNSSELLGKTIGKTHSFKGLDDVEKGINKQASNKIKRNGLTWNRTCDTFQYSVQLPVREKLKTNRKEEFTLP
uniref:SFRICE_041502 n=1 Tax=Spodoptera frugiperda TaxID=7108 RepID=A0A2H1W779_SPOFR